MKRPLMACGIAFVVGVAAAYLLVPIFGLLLAVGILSVLYKRWTDISYTYIVGMSVFLIVGFCRMMSVLNTDVDMENEGQICIQKIQEKEQVTYLYGKNEKGATILAVVEKEGNEDYVFYKGQQYRISGEAQSFKKSTNPGQFDEAAYYQSQGVAYRIWVCKIEKVSEGDGLHQALRFLEDFKRSLCRFYEEHMETEQAGILQAAVVGERSGLLSEVKAYYQANGWMHLITTSGLHLSFIAMGVYKRLRKMTVHQPVSTVLAFAVMFAYGYMTDFGDSMLRAIGMMIFQLMGKLLGRRTDGMTTLFFLSAFMLFFRPMRILSSGFWLTFTAVGGMELGGWLYKQWKVFAGREMRLVQNVCIQSGIFIVTLPVLLWFMYEIPAYGFFYNFFMIPLISLIVPLAFAAGIVGILHLPILFKIACLMIKLMDILLKLIHHLPSKVWVCGRPRVWQMFLFIAFLAVCIAFVRYKKWRCAMLIFTINIFALMFLRFRSDEVLFMDVGQGDGICILTKQGQAVFIDGGSSDVNNLYTYRLKPMLKYYGIDTVSAWFLTHGDSDHTSGIFEALEMEADIEQIFLPDVDNDETLDEIRAMAEENDILVQKIKPDQRVTAGSFTWTCLYPMQDWITEDKNQNSLVLCCRHENGTSILFTGDIEKEGEQRLLSYARLQNVDILKVAHHGSSGGTSEAFLEQTRPEWAVISCGEDNRYGHPHTETLSRLETAGCKWVTTAAQGSVCVQMNSDGYKIFGAVKND